MPHSAIRLSNCGARGIFDISRIETQQLRLAWHAVGVLGRVAAAKRVLKNNLPLRATHTCARSNTSLLMHTLSCVSPICHPPRPMTSPATKCDDGNGLKSTSCSSLMLLI